MQEITKELRTCCLLVIFKKFQLQRDYFEASCNCDDSTN